MRKKPWLLAGLVLTGVAAWMIWNQQTDAEAHDIFEDRKLVVGTTGDYKPFTYWNEERNRYQGFDIDVIQAFAKAANLDVTFVKTTWPTLSEDTKSGKFDIAVGGITKKVEREVVGDFTSSYFSFQKAPLVKKKDVERLNSLAAINDPGVKIGVNPGGTNEAFVKKHFPKADVTVFENNLDIPKAVKSGQVDVMVTDDIEALHYATELDLAVPKLTEAWEPAEMAYLMKPDQKQLGDVFRVWIESAEGQEQVQKLKKKWNIVSTRETVGAKGAGAHE
ncbi:MULTISPECIES: transporter substrate-binding domain-containing protein [unclassified Exiguobacterium]|uniref:transporter substrate-binding domain-containing protein n=1 Tax=unclassified Exiguobacterium TaxID=2644629 RepID=UPI000425291A|nr:MULTISPECIES: transporter substrate-binding domain-containing protein [unclassified Exiguobacterium]MCQ4090681.1 transporter substrate-binding domain-containing protein [Exiguobacterium sp. LL15]